MLGRCELWRAGGTYHIFGVQSISFAELPKYILPTSVICFLNLSSNFLWKKDATHSFSALASKFLLGPICKCIANNFRQNRMKQCFIARFKCTPRCLCSGTLAKMFYMQDVSLVLGS